MTTLTQELNLEREELLDEFVTAYTRLPEGPLPMTPETIQALAELIAALYGDALLELEKH